MLAPIGMPDEWHSSNRVLADDCCELVGTPRRTVRDWLKRGVNFGRTG